MIRALRSGETDSLQYFFAAYSEAAQACEALKQRFEAAGVYDKVEMVRDSFAEILRETLRTIPKEKRKTIQKNMANQSLKIITGVEACKDADFTYCPTDALYDVFNEAAQWKCSMCDGTSNEMSTCKLRKAIRKVVMVDSGNESDCEYKFGIWE